MSDRARAGGGTTGLFTAQPLPRHLLRGPPSLPLPLPAGRTTRGPRWRTLTPPTLAPTGRAPPAALARERVLCTLPLRETS